MARSREVFLNTRETCRDGNFDLPPASYFNFSFVLMHFSFFSLFFFLMTYLKSVTYKKNVKTEFQI